jgi:hypothetical protein
MYVELQQQVNIKHASAFCYCWGPWIIGPVQLVVGAGLTEDVAQANLELLEVLRYF